ncbi:MAG: cyclopropane fatty acyl phospholipid synthase [Fulvivirga sp.]
MSFFVIIKTAAMKTSYYQKIVCQVLEDTGININGNQPEDPKIRDPRFFKAVIQNGSLALGEAYMHGWWDCEALDVFFEKILKAGLDKKVKNKFLLWLQLAKSSLFNQQSKSRAIVDIDKHYNIGNDLYKNMLDPHMMYSCGYWDNAEDLYQAQTNKLELICQKLHLKPGMRVLEIGCGWGGFAVYAAKNFGVEVIGITLSSEQEKLAKERCQQLNVEIRLQDYRDLNDQFDRIVSIGMFEHVGYKNYPVYMDVVNRNLKEDGISLLHTIGSNSPSTHRDPWLDKYIFPNSRLPTAVQIISAIEKEGFVLQDWHSFGRYYDYTLMAWLNNFRKSWSLLKHNYNEIFYRMWVYYLSCCAASFRVGDCNLWQIVFTKLRYDKEYQAVRSICNAVSNDASLLAKI